MEEIYLFKQLKMIQKHMITLKGLQQVKVMIAQLNVSEIILISK